MLIALWITEAYILKMNKIIEMQKINDIFLLFTENTENVHSR